MRGRHSKASRSPRRAALVAALTVAVAASGAGIAASSASADTSTLLLDTHSTSPNPTVSTVDPLQVGVRYLYEVDGTFSYYNAQSWNTHTPWCGPWEQKPMYASPVGDNYHVGADASVAFGQQGPGCPGIYGGQRSLQIDSGDGTFRRIAPVGGEPRLNFAAAGHKYSFVVTGTGARARFQILDGNATDNYGVLHVRQVAADATAPVVTPSVSPGAPGSNGYYTSPQTVTWSTTDPESGISSKSGCDTTTISQETTGQVLTCTATNGVGLTTTASITIAYDGTAPVITSTAPAPDGSNGWYVTPASVSWDVSDTISGVSSRSGCDPAALSPSAAGAITCSATNGAGLSGSSTFAYKYDPSPAIITPTLSGTLGSNGWYTTAPSVTWAVSDSLSGIDSTSGCDNTTLTAETAGTSLTCTVVNGAGLMSSSTVLLKYDGTAPTVTWSGNLGSYDADATVTLTCAATDGLSGIATSTCRDITVPGYTIPAAGLTYSATAADVAGNTGTGSTTVRLSTTPDGLCRLVTAWVNQDGVAHSLCVKLAKAATDASNGKPKNLDAFRNELAAQSGKSITAEHADILTRLSRAIG
jgi:hypothetical protein